MSRFASLVIVLGTLAFLASGPARLAAANDAAAQAHGDGGGETAALQAAAHEEPNILEFKPSLAIATLVVFLLLLGILWKFAWGPLTVALHDREERMRLTLEETERARADADRLLAEHRLQMEKAGEQVRALLDDARKSALANADEIVKKAQGEADANRERAVRDIGTARDQALQELVTRSADLAVGIAGKVLDREIRPEDHARLIADAMAQLPATPANGQGSRRS
jgi:F-type H+-transporting ATPase subunit b